MARERLSIDLRLALQAVLQQRWDDYRRCLSRGISRLQEQFERQDSEVLELLSLLQQQQQPLQQAFPQQLQSQIVLEAFLQRWLGDPRLLSSQAGTVH